MNRKTVLLVIALSVSPVLMMRAQAVDTPVPAAKKLTVDEVAAKVQSNYRKTKTIQAKFVQETFVPGSRKPRMAEGHVYFKLPGKMNWDYEKPQPLKYVSNGTVFFYYNAEENYMAVKKLDEAFDSPTPSNFLKGLGELKEAFTIREPDLGLFDGEGNYRVHLESKDPKLGNFQMTLIIDPKSFRLLGLHQADPQGSRTTIKFSEITENGEIADHVFMVNPPEGTKIQKF